MSTRHWAWAGFTKCPECGGTIYIATESSTPQEFHEGDEVLCTGCGVEGVFEFDQEGNLGFIAWYSEEETEYDTQQTGSGECLKSESPYSLMQTS